MLGKKIYTSIIKIYGDVKIGHQWLMLAKKYQHLWWCENTRHQWSMLVNKISTCMVMWKYSINDYACQKKYKKLINMETTKIGELSTDEIKASQSTKYITWLYTKIWKITTLRYKVKVVQQMSKWKKYTPCTIFQGIYT